MPARVLRHREALYNVTDPVAFEKHQCPRGYYDPGTPVVAYLRDSGALRSTNAREGITTRKTEG